MIAKGCVLCKKGAKLVLFVSGLCDTTCYYCPLSNHRRKDSPYANERPILNDSDLLLEADRMHALGASITGGEPLLRLDKTTHYIKVLKEVYGQKFHIHLYTFANKLDDKSLNQLASAGLDEIRLHSNFQKITLARHHFFDVGVEIPIIPDKNAKTRYIDLLNSLNNKIDFMNLNELEFSHTNEGELTKRGFEQKDELSHAALGSEELALQLVEHSKSASLSYEIHYCSSNYKDAVQYRNRLKRTADNIHKPYEKPTGDGLLKKGVIIPKKPTDLKTLRQNLIKSLSLSPSQIQIDAEKNRLETTPTIARRAAKKQSLNIKAAIVEEFPTFERYEAQYEPLN